MKRAEATILFQGGELDIPFEYDAKSTIYGWFNESLDELPILGDDNEQDINELHGQAVCVGRIVLN